jgi:sigma54-dependent transcription regulator
MLMACNRQDFHANLGQGSNYSDSSSTWFSSVVPRQGPDIQIDNFDYTLRAYDYGLFVTITTTIPSVSPICHLLQFTIQNRMNFPDFFGLICQNFSLATDISCTCYFQVLLYFPINSLTYSMEQSPSSEANQ